MFWHIATGRWIVRNGSVPTTDPFSWWAAPLNKPWVALEWLFGLIAYGVYWVVELAILGVGGWLAVAGSRALGDGYAFALQRSRLRTSLALAILGLAVAIAALIIFAGK